MGGPHHRRAAPGETLVENRGAEHHPRPCGDLGVHHRRSLSMNVQALVNAAEDGPPPLASVPAPICAILERLEVGRPFSFGEATLNSDKSSAVLQGPSLALIVVWGESLSVCGSGGRRKHLKASHCGLFLFDGELSLKLDGAVPAAIAWCQMRIDTGSGGTAPALYATPQIRISDQVRTLIRLGLDVRSTASAASSETYRDAIGIATVSAFSAEIGGWAQLPAIVRRAREHADAHFMEDCDLSLLAEVAGVTKEHLTTAFRKHVGMTPVRYLWSVRARNAARLVQSSDLNLSMIADRCGYKSPYHLSREIKRLTGVSPREMRRRDSGS